jgi:hypothetical protein
MGCKTIHGLSNVTKLLLNPVALIILSAYSSGRTVVGLQPLAWWDCEFESHREHGCVSLCECCVLTDRVFCVGLITRPEESFRVWCV